MRGAGGASSKLTLCLPHGAGPAGRPPSPVCRCPFYFLQSRGAPAVRAPGARETASPRQGEWGWQRKGRFSGPVGWGTPLFHGRNKLAALELSCLSSLVLALLQRFQVRGLLRSEAHAVVHGGRGVGGTVALLRATIAQASAAQAQLCCSSPLGRVLIPLQGSPDSNSLAGPRPVPARLLSQEAPLLLSTQQQSPHPRPLATMVAEDSGTGHPNSAHTLPLPAFCLQRRS